MRPLTLLTALENREVARETLFCLLTRRRAKKRQKLRRLSACASMVLVLLIKNSAANLVLLDGQETCALFLMTEKSGTTDVKMNSKPRQKAQFTFLRARLLR